MEEDWDGKYIQVKLTLDNSQVGIRNQVRAAFSERGCAMVNVELELPPPDCRTKTLMKKKRKKLRQPTELFELFHQENFGEKPDECLGQTFAKLLNLAKKGRNSL